MTDLQALPERIFIHIPVAEFGDISVKWLSHEGSSAIEDVQKIVIICTAPQEIFRGHNTIGEHSLQRHAQLGVLAELMAQIRGTGSR